MPVIETSTKLACSPGELRTFLGQTANLEDISDPELEFQIVKAPEMVAANADIEFRVSAYGFKQRITHRWVEVTENTIVAEQVDGPTKTWKHTQVISEVPGGCQLVDRIEFDPPGGMLGFVMTADKISESIEEGMAFRYETLQERFGSLD